VRRDFAVAAALAVLTVAAVLARPPVLGASDEALYLYEAKALLGGARLYRDVYDIVPPGSLWLLAAAFALFGTTFAVARAFAAVVQAALAVAVYGAARRLDARPALAALAALVVPALCHPTWPYASPHWLGALLAVTLVPAVIPRRGRAAPRGWAAGLLLGTLATIQHQKAAVLGAGAVVALGLDRALAGELRAVPAVLGRLVAGALAVVAPVALAVVARVGVAAPFRALVLQPLENYHAVIRTRWGAVGPWHRAEARETFPRLLAAAPGAAGAALALAAAAGIVQRRPDAVRRAVAMLVLLAASVGSILYFPDYIHLAFVAPVVAVAVAGAAEALLGAVATTRGRRAAVAAALVLLLATVGVRIVRHTARLRAAPGVRYASPFGTVVVAPRMAAFLARTRERLVAAGATETFCYPGYPALYLYLGVANATPYQLAAPGYSPPAQLDEIVATLARRRLPYVITVPAVMTGRHDRVSDAIAADYAPVDDTDWTLGPVLMRRKSG
jgi:hypothetical protein